VSSLYSDKMMTHFTPKNAEKYYCEKCYFTCSKSSDWGRHILTRKHKNDDNDDKKNAVYAKHLSKHFECDCGKKYVYRQGLSIHRKKCPIFEKNVQILKKMEYQNSIICENEMNEINEKDLILNLLNQNNQLQNQIIEICKERTNLSINNGNINSNNKTFNLNVFLNEHCKDAMNIMDFVDSLKLQLTDLENVGKLGFVEGISNIIVKNLKALDVTQRPVHCSDTKREVLYVKDEDKWEKENQEKKKLKKAIKHIAHKNSKMLQEFKAKYPDCIYSDSKKSDQYNKIIIEAMGGLENETDESENKIIKRIAKEVMINKC